MQIGIMRSLIVSLLFSFFCIVVFVYASDYGVQYQGFFDIKAKHSFDIFSIVYGFILFLFTVTGIYSKNLYDYIKNREVLDLSVFMLLQKVFISKDFILSIIISPIVFTVVYKAAGSIPDNMVAFLFAYENGFFFNSIVSRFGGDDDTKK